MRLQDLKFLKKEPPPNKENTRLLINRVQSFLQAAESSEAPKDFENPDDTQQYIELDLFIPKGFDESNFGLVLPVDTASGSSGSSSSSTTSSSDASDIEETSTNERLPDPEKLRPSKRPKIEELDCVSNADDKRGTTL
ncbi:hypothetical protein EGR_04245 [Echinococcus granulosus]|uniref:Expressed conserved protein n=1 Tax=Echinococcus granulosus TaxID=6210 RepID=U6JHC0_ECHGR|nr:hypothetical protein EGR_04245 [Echinococcus granulosus]EUB60999.1 hypothetical protein EGR_04245 [Echinococcus granulosus]CDS21848.1 expressed conserved protein [Echinococcus granulosus]